MPPPGEVPACHPKTCAELGLACGELDDDGCGRSVRCGTCSGYETCGGGGTPGVCGCTPEVSCGPRDCGTLDDGCGHQLQCNEGQCPEGQSCGTYTAPGICGCYGDDEDGPRGATAGANFSVGAGFVAWEDLGEVAAEDGVGARATMTKDSFSGAIHISDYLVASGFGFALPATASINGIQVEIVRKASLPDDIEDHRLQLFSGGRLVGTAQGGYGGERWSDAWETRTYHGSLWGHGWTVDEINSPDFGVALSVIGSYTDASADALVDSVKVTVRYEHDCTCDYRCEQGDECGDDGCGGTCGAGCDAADTCSRNLCAPPIYTDPDTGLMWKNSGAYSATLNACLWENLGGYDDWRVPSFDELRTLVTGCPATATGGACQVTSTCTSQATCYDSSCEGCGYGCFAPPRFNEPACNNTLVSDTRDGSYRWTLNLGSGAISRTMFNGYEFVRCVRGP